MSALADTERSNSAQPYEFRGTTKIDRARVRAMEVAHESFSRQTANIIGSYLRGAAQMEQVATSQMPFSEYIATLPVGGLLGVIDSDDLQAPIIIDMDVELALAIANRLQGGSGRPPSPRRLSNLEQRLLREVLAEAVTALGESLKPYLADPPRLSYVESSPQRLQVTRTTELVVYMAFKVDAVMSGGPPINGIMSLCYPASATDLIASKVHTVAESDGDTAGFSLAEPLLDTVVDVAAHLGAAPMPARQLSRLAVGDIVRLGVEPGEPAVVLAAGRPVATAHAARRGRNLAVRVAATRTTDPDPERKDLS